MSRFFWVVGMGNPLFFDPRYERFTDALRAAPEIKEKLLTDFLRPRFDRADEFSVQFSLPLWESEK